MSMKMHLPASPGAARKFWQSDAPGEAGKCVFLDFVPYKD